MTPATVRRLAATLSLVGGFVVAAYLLFGVGYTMQSESSVAAPSGGPAVTTVTQTRHLTGLAYALQEREWALVLWAGFVVVVCSIAAMSAWTGRARPIWGAAAALGVLSVLGLASIGLVIAPLALLLALAASAVSGRWRLGRRVR